MKKKPLLANGFFVRCSLFPSFGLSPHALSKIILLKPQEFQKLFAEFLYVPLNTKGCASCDKPNAEHTR